MNAGRGPEVLPVELGKEFLQRAFEIDGCVIGGNEDGGLRGLGHMLRRLPPGADWDKGELYSSLKRLGLPLIDLRKICLEATRRRLGSGRVLSCKTRLKPMILRQWPWSMELGPLREAEAASLGKEFEGHLESSEGSGTP